MSKLLVHSEQLFSTKLCRNFSSVRNGRGKGHGKGHIPKGVVPIEIKFSKSKQNLPSTISNDATAKILSEPKSYSSSKKKSPFANMDENGLPILHQKDCFRRVEFASKMLEILEKDPSILEHILFTDEGNFRLTKVTSNKRNKDEEHGAGEKKKSKATVKIRKSAESKPLPQIVFCGMTSNHIIGPYFFNSHVTDRSYKKMLQTYLIPQLQRLGEGSISKFWFQQDGAPPHRSRAVLSYLTKTFGKRLISYGCPLTWPPKSQDLTPLDYFLWDKLKANLSSNCLPSDLSTEEKFRNTLVHEIDEISEEQLTEIIAQFPVRLEKCIEANGDRFVM